jgi:hypothetical protein
MRARRVWGGIWTVLAWFVLLRASGVQWLLSPDSATHAIRIAGAYAVVVPVMAYALVLLGKRLRLVLAVAVLNVHVLAVAWLRGGTTAVPTLRDVGWSFVGVAVGALLAAALGGPSLRRG